MSKRLPTTLPVIYHTGLSVIPQTFQTCSCPRNFVLLLFFCIKKYLQSSRLKTIGTDYPTVSTSRNLRRSFAGSSGSGLSGSWGRKSAGLSSSEAWPGAEAPLPARILPGAASRRGLLAGDLGFSPRGPLCRDACASSWHGGWLSPEMFREIQVETAMSFTSQLQNLHIFYCRIRSHRPALLQHDKRHCKGTNPLWEARILGGHLGGWLPHPSQVSLPFFSSPNSGLCWNVISSKRSFLLSREDTLALGPSSPSSCMAFRAFSNAWNYDSSPYVLIISVVGETLSLLFTVQAYRQAQCLVQSRHSGNVFWVNGFWSSGNKCTLSSLCSFIPFCNSTQREMLAVT